MGEPMTHRERVLSALSYQGYDRIPVSWDGTPEINAQMMKRYGLADYEALLTLVGDDCRHFSPPYIGPKLRTFEDGSWEGLWGERYNLVAFEDGSYPEAVFLPFAGIEDPSKLEPEKFPTAAWWDYSEAKAQAQRLHDAQFVVWTGGAGDLDFINGISRCRGMEEVLEDLALENEAFEVLIEARFRLYYDFHERMLQACDGLIDIAHCGEDLGNQRGPMISMKMFERHFAPRYGAFFKMVHGYGARTMMHMCGCTHKFLPRLIELGLDIYDVVQPTTPEMDIANLKRELGDRLAYRGTMCVQSTLPWGTVADVEREVERRKTLFARGGLILGPTHAIQVRTPLENIEAMYRAAGSWAGARVMA
jgi:uroporphyrinogen decarboxylase